MRRDPVFDADFVIPLGTRGPRKSPRRYKGIRFHPLIQSKGCGLFEVRRRRAMLTAKVLTRLFDKKMLGDAATLDEHAEIIKQIGSAIYDVGNDAHYGPLHDYIFQLAADIMASDAAVKNGEDRRNEDIAYSMIDAFKMGVDAATLAFRPLAAVLDREVIARQQKAFAKDSKARQKKEKAKAAKMYGFRLLWLHLYPRLITVDATNEAIAIAMNCTPRHAQRIRSDWMQIHVDEWAELDASILENEPDAASELADLARSVKDATLVQLKDVAFLQSLGDIIKMT